MRKNVPTISSSRGRPCGRVALAVPRAGGDSARSSLHGTGPSPPSPPTPARVQLWQRNFLAVWPSMLAVTVGLMGMLPTLPFYIEQRFGLTDVRDVEFWTAWTFGAAPLSAAVCGPFWGVLGDRVGRKMMLLRAQLGIAVALGLMPFAEQPEQLVALRVLQGVFAGFIAPAMALVTASAPPEHSGRVIARLQLALALGLAIGPAAAAEVAAAWGRAAVFHTGSIAAGIGFLCVLVFAVEDRRALRPRRHEGGSGVGLALRNPQLLAVLAVAFGMRLGLQMVEPFTALWVRQLGPLAVLAPDDPTLALDRTAALAFTVLAVAQIAITTRWGRWADRYGPMRCLAVVASGLAVVLIATSTVRATGSYLALRCVGALLMAGIMTLAYAAVARRVSTEHRSLAFGLVQSCMQLGIASGPVVGHALIPVVGLRGVFAVAGVHLGAVACAALWIWRRRFNDEASAGTGCSPSPAGRGTAR